ncbi:hypothetical protein [Natrinema limicola]|uniref:Uncharacterized protein n=1 Tax=Natrinema limicola JCM 13563 TaxID=1230457 RepID=M0CJS8_9EURY|nr:hypothetical protein [Natrinema limicola]ELZ22617.1 hypothetical protein C476_05822 [Natrinema limicola JCM 13563]
MSSSRRDSRDPRWVLLAVLLGSLSLALLAVSRLEIPRDRLSVGAVLVGTLLVVGTLALPALLFAGWQSGQE